MSSVSTAFKVHYNQKLGGGAFAILGGTHQTPLLVGVNPYIRYGAMWRQETKNVFPGRSMVGGKRPLLLQILSQTDPFGAKTPIFNRYSVVAPQP